MALSKGETLADWSSIEQKVLAEATLCCIAFASPGGNALLSRSLS